MKIKIFNIQRFSVQDGPGIRTTVFVKGCPLRCPWCANPESQKLTLEVGHVDVLCNQCSRCLDVCEGKVISLAGKGIRINRELCNDCGDCVPVCPENSLRTFGREASLDEILEELKKDSLYYSGSNGGITVSGGEPLSQPQPVAELLKRCHEAGFHTTLDTSGYGSPAAMKLVLEHTDLVLFDLKLMDLVAHQEVIKTSNKPIFNNCKLVAKMGVPMIIRIPLIPGITDTTENISAIAQFVKEELGSGVVVNLMPYHRFGKGKYAALDLEYQLREQEPLPDDQIKKVAELVEGYGLHCEVIL